MYKLDTNPTKNGLNQISYINLLIWGHSKNVWEYHDVVFQGILK